MLDLRVPSGWFFALLGAILLGMGAFAPPDMGGLLTDANVDLYSGGGMLAFGAFLLILARLSRNPQ